MIKDSAAHCNAVFFLPILVAYGYFEYVGHHQLYLGVLGLHVVASGFVWLAGVAALNVPAGPGVLLCVGRPPRSFVQTAKFIFTFKNKAHSFHFKQYFKLQLLSL
jgi:hypothetical protein